MCLQYPVQYLHIEISVVIILDPFNHANHYYFVVKEKGKNTTLLRCSFLCLPAMQYSEYLNVNFANELQIC